MKELLVRHGSPFGDVIRAHHVKPADRDDDKGGEELGERESPAEEDAERLDEERLSCFSRLSAARACLDSFSEAEKMI